MRASRTPWASGRRRFLLACRRRASLDTVSPEKKMGWMGSDTRSVYFDEMEVPSSHILGQPDKGFKQFLKTLTGGRISIAALGLGICEAGYQAALKYATERDAFGRKISDFQSIGFKLSDMAMQIEAAKHLVYNAAYLKDQGKSITKEAAMAKLFTSELAMNITTEAIQIHGGYGYIREYNVERFFRDAKILEIGEGTSEVQRIVIARALVVKPKVIIADEPVSMLDVSIRAEILELMSEIQKNHKISFIYITHDLATAKYFADRIIILYDGKIVETGDINDVLTKPKHPYTEALIEAISEPDPKNLYKEKKIRWNVEE